MYPVLPGTLLPVSILTVMAHQKLNMISQAQNCLPFATDQYKAMDQYNNWDPITIIMDDMRGSRIETAIHQECCMIHDMCLNYEL